MEEGSIHGRGFGSGSAAKQRPRGAPWVALDLVSPSRSLRPSTLRLGTRFCSRQGRQLRPLPEVRLLRRASLGSATFLRIHNVLDHSMYFRNCMSHVDGDGLGSACSAASYEIFRRQIGTVSEATVSHCTTRIDEVDRTAAPRVPDSLDSPQSTREEECGRDPVPLRDRRRGWR